MLVTLLVLGGCPSSQEIKTARASAYDTDFAIVYNETLDAVREVYPEGISDNPATGLIRTAWQPVAYQSGAGDAQQGGGAANGDPSVGGTSAVNPDPTSGGTGGTSDPHNFTSTSGALGKAQFIRFDIAVAGGRPWHVDVRAYASEWEQGNAEPTMLKGPATPHWLAGRRDALEVAIYRKLKQYAVHYQAPVDQVAKAPPTPEVDPKTFGAIPAGAIATATAIVKAVETRDPAALRAQVADDVQWSLGADGDAGTAMAMWQADPQTLATLGAILRAGCRGDDKAVTCPPDATETPGYVGWRARLEPKGASWKLTSFVQGD